MSCLFTAEPLGYTSVYHSILSVRLNMHYSKHFCNYIQRAGSLDEP